VYGWFPILYLIFYPFFPSTYIDMPYFGSTRLVFDLPAVPVWSSLRRPLPSPRSAFISHFLLWLHPDPDSLASTSRISLW
jgi:hypothetical protein